MPAGVGALRRSGVWKPGVGRADRPGNSRPCQDSRRRGWSRRSGRRGDPSTRRPDARGRHRSGPFPQEQGCPVCRRPVRAGSRPVRLRPSRRRDRRSPDHRGPADPAGSFFARPGGQRPRPTILASIAGVAPVANMQSKIAASTSDTPDCDWTLMPPKTGCRQVLWLSGSMKASQPRMSSASARRHGSDVRRIGQDGRHPRLRRKGLALPDPDRGEKAQPRRIRPFGRLFRDRLVQEFPERMNRRHHETGGHARGIDPRCRRRVVLFGPRVRPRRGKGR